jgi:hypothetical protein
MESILQADIFFFITSIFVIILILVLCASGYYLVKAMRNFSIISETLKGAVEDTDDELREMVSDVRESTLFRFIFGAKKMRKEYTKKHTTKK